MAMLGKQSSLTYGPLLGTEMKPLCVSAIGDMSFSATQVDATCYNESLYRKYIAGLKEPGAMDVTVNYQSNDAGIEMLYDSFLAGTSLVFVLTWPDGAIWKFNGVITGYTATTPIDEKVQQTFSIQISGEPDFIPAPVPENVVVTFKANGGSGTMNPVTAPTASEYTVPACTFTPPSGQQFANWVDGNGVAHEAEDTINLKHNTTLTAVWEATG